MKASRSPSIWAKQNERPWSIFAILAAIVFISAAFSYIKGNGFSKGSDLTQHYVAGTLWNENKSSALYEDFELSRRLIEWNNASSDVRPKEGQDSLFLNYIYSPLIARIAAAFVPFGFSTWIRVFLSMSIACSIFSWVLLAKTGTGINTKSYKDWALLVSFPGLWLPLFVHQNSSITFFFVSLAAFLESRNLGFWAGAALAAVFYKPHFVIFMALILLWAGRLRTLIGLALTSLSLLAAQLMIFGWDLNLGWIKSMYLSLTRRQFERVALNHSWRGWLLSIPGSASTYFSLVTLMVSIAICILAGLWLQKVIKNKLLKSQHALLVAAAIWPLASPYTPWYEFLMFLGLYALVCRSLPETRINIGLCFMGWVVSLLTFLGPLNYPWLTAPLVTLWIILAAKALSLKLSVLPARS